MKFPEQFRIKSAVTLFETQEGDPFGAFFVPAQKLSSERTTRPLKVIACDGTETGWEHVSVSLPLQPKATPSWAEMCLIKDLFWDPSECVVQFHPPEEDYVNVHQGVLHLWKCVNATFPLPPKSLV